MKQFRKSCLLVVAVTLICGLRGLAQQVVPATIKVDLEKEIAPMRPIWAWFGYDEPNYTYMKDGKKLLSEIAALSPTPV